MSSAPAAGSTDLERLLSAASMAGTGAGPRRWSTLALGWLCGGQWRLLETCARLFDNTVGWSVVMEVPSPHGGSAAARLVRESAMLDATIRPKSKKAKKAKAGGPSAKQSSSSSPVKADGVPGNLSLVAHIACIVDAVHDAGAM